MVKKGLALAATLVTVSALASTPAKASSFVVSPQYDSVLSDIFVTAGQQYNLTATGLVNLALFDGPYITDANGAIVSSPPVGSGAYNYFSQFGTPSVGNVLNYSGPYNAPFGALAMWNNSLSQWQTVGTNAIFTAEQSGYLSFAVSSTGWRSDDTGSFTIDVKSVPEPTTLLGLAIAGISLVALKRKSSSPVA